MWQLSKRGHLKCFEYNPEYDEQGHLIVYKDDIDTLLWLDRLNDSGAEHERKKAEATAKMRERMGQR